MATQFDWNPHAPVPAPLDSHRIEYEQEYDPLRDPAVLEEFYPEGLFYVNEYLHDLAYGGPEEGGWYFECGRFVRMVAVTQDPDLARTLQANHQQKLDQDENAGRRDITSVLSQGRYVARLEGHVGHDYPAVQPHYE